jgi:hypothetical protein
MAAAVSTAVYADEVEDTIKEALQAYQNKDLKGAAESLDYASTLIRQQKGSALEQFLPEPLSGWSAEPAQSTAAGAGFLGGGVSAQREYSKDDKHLTISLVTDSPMLAGMMAMFGNPMFAASEGAKMQRINGQKAMVKYAAGASDGEITLVVSNTLVTVSGTASEEELLAYAKKIDVARLSKQ